MTLSSVVPAPATPTWQNPYVEVIRYGFAHRNVGWQQHGDVEQVTDSVIQKNVFKIRGTIAATNYVRFPREVSKANQGLGLTGRYIYIQLRRARGQQATLHLDLLTGKKSAVRFSLSSMFSSLRSSGTVLRVPLDVSEAWTTVVVDMAEMLQLHGFNGYSREGFRYLKAVTCCASMNLRNVITSSTLYTPESLPPNLALPAAHENQFGPFGWIAFPAALGIRSTTHAQASERIKRLGVEDGSKYFDFDAVDADEVDDDEADEFAREGFAAVSPMPRSPQPSAEPVVPLSPNIRQEASVNTNGTGGPPLSPTSRAAGLIRDREDVLSRADQIMRDAGFSVPSPRRRIQSQHEGERGIKASARGQAVSEAAARGVISPRRFLASEHSDWPDPILSLTRTIGFSTAFPGALRWIPDAPACVYTSYSTIILREFTADGGGQAKRDFPSLLSNQHNQEVGTRSAWTTHGSAVADSGEALTDDHEVFLTGHTGEICALEVSSDGTLLASAQNSPQCVLRIWSIRRGDTNCAIVMKAPTKSVHVLAFSKDATAFCCVGMDDHARTQIFVWDSSCLFASPAEAVGTKKLILRARQTCDFPIQAIAFSPYESDQLVSCGKENVRFWRVNDARHHLPGSPVILKEYSRGTAFTDIAFDCVYPQFPSNLPRVRPIYVSSSAGSILVVNYDTREVVCVYKLHDAAINSICVNEGFCVTGSDDKFLRVWPLDFSDFFLEAEHEAPVKGVDISSDGMRVAVGTSNGAIGVLHLADQRYRTVLRSHTQPVGAMASLSDEAFVTSASDGTLRVWNATTGTQTMEFDVSKDLVTCLAAMPSQSPEGAHLTVAVGFQSGCTRIFSLGRSAEIPGESPAIEPRVLHEFQQHQSALCDVQYQSDAKTLYTSADGQQLCMYDVAQGYTPIKMLIADIDPSHGKMCLSRDRRFLAVLLQGRRSVLLLDALSLCVVRVLTPPKPTQTTAGAGQGDMQELTQVVISWNSQELLTLTRADRLHVFSLSEAQPGGLQSSVSFGSVIHSMPLLGQQGITSLALSPNLKYMATGGSDSSVRVWQCEFGKHKFQRMNQTFRLHAGQGAVRGLVFSSDGRRLIAASDSSRAAFVWRFRGNISKLPALELHDSAKEPSRLGHHGDFELPLEDIANKNEPASTPITAREDSPKPVEISELKVSTSVSNISWKRLIPAKQDSSPRSVVWASRLGILVSITGHGRVVVVEKLESAQQYFLHPIDGADHLVLSPSQGLLAILSPKKDIAQVYNLEAFRPETNQTEGENEGADLGRRVASTLIRVPFSQRLETLSAIEFSVDGSLLCVSGEVARLPVLFVVDIHSGGELMWSVNSASTTPVTRIFSQSPREFVCASTDARRPLQRLRVPPFSLSSAALTLEPIVEISLPSQPQLFCFRDDGAALANVSGIGGQQQRSRFGVSVDSEAYCYFLDLERQRKMHTMQLLLPSTRAKVTEIQWVGTNEWQALLAALDDDTIAVFALPTQFTFTSTKLRVASMDWAQLKRTGRLTSALVVPFDGQRIATLLVDPLSEAGVVTTEDGATISVNFRTGQRRVLYAAPTLQVFSSPSTTPQLAMNGALVVTLSSDRRALQCWEPTIGRELARLHVPTALCSCFSVSPFDTDLVAAGYEDGSLRVFDVKEQQLVAQCLLPPAPQRGRPSSGGKSRGAASPGEALSIIKEKQSAKRSAVNSPLPNGRHLKGLKELYFIGPRCVLVVTNSSRVVLFDLSDVALTPEGGVVVAEAADTSSKRPSLSKPLKAKEKTIHYRDITLPAPDRVKGIPKAQRSALQSSSSSAGWDVEITSIDVQLCGGQSPVKSQRRHAAPRDGDELNALTHPFLIVAKMTDRGRGTTAVVAHVFAGNAIPAGHPVHAEEDVAPCDSWVVHASGQPLFHPSNACQVVSLVVDDEVGQWIEVRDFQANAATLRLAIPTTINETTALGSCSLMRWHTQGKSIVALIDGASPARPKPLAVVDLTRRSLVQVNHEGDDSGAFVLASARSGRSDAKALLVAVAPPSLTPGEEAIAGLVLAELTRTGRTH